MPSTSSLSDPPDKDEELPNAFNAVKAVQEESEHTSTSGLSEPPSDGDDVLLDASETHSVVPVGSLSENGDHPSTTGLSDAPFNDDDILLDASETHSVVPLDYLYDSDHAMDSGTENMSPADTQNLAPTNTEKKAPTDTEDKAPTITGEKAPTITGEDAPTGTEEKEEVPFYVTYRRPFPPELIDQVDACGIFEFHTNSVCCVIHHPLDPTLIVSGGGDERTYVWDTIHGFHMTKHPVKIFPPGGCVRHHCITRIEGHKDTVQALEWSHPDGKYLITGGMDGKVQVFSLELETRKFTLVGEVHEVAEVFWVLSTPNPKQPHTFAFGAGDGSVWVYSIKEENKQKPLQYVAEYALHQGPVNVGAWTPDGKLLFTTGEGGALYGYDVFGEAKALGVRGHNGTSEVLSFDGDDIDFCLDGGIYAMAVHPSGDYLVVGGGMGMIRAIRLPEVQPNRPSRPPNYGLEGAKGPFVQLRFNKSGYKRGQIINTIHVFCDSIESLSFSSPPYNMLAACSTDGTIAVFEAWGTFQMRRYIEKAHGGHAIVKVDWCREKGRENLLTSCGLDGSVKRWEGKGNTYDPPNEGLIREWKGHEGGAYGAPLDFTQDAVNGKIITAGDDALCHVFDTALGQDDDEPGAAATGGNEGAATTDKDVVVDKDISTEMAATTIADK